LFAALYYFFFSLARANIKQGKQAALSLALALAAAAYLFSLLFSFTIVVGEIYFWLFMGLLVTINYAGSAIPLSEEPLSRRPFLLAAKIGLALIFIVFAGYGH